MWFALIEFVKSCGRLQASTRWATAGTMSQSQRWAAGPLLVTHSSVTPGRLILELPAGLAGPLLPRWVGSPHSSWERGGKRHWDTAPRCEVSAVTLEQQLQRGSAAVYKH